MRVLYILIAAVAVAGSVALALSAYRQDELVRAVGVEPSAHL